MLLITKQRGVMNRYFSKFYALLAVTAALSSSSSAEADHSLQFGAGYRQDTITWDVDHSEYDVPYLSDDDLRFYDLDIFFLGARAKGNLGCSYYRADLEYGWVFNGREREKAVWTTAQTETPIPNTTFSNIERTTIESRVHNHCKKRYTLDFNVGIGYPFNFCCNEFSLTPMIGYSYNTQRLRVKDDQKIGENLTTAQQAAVQLEPFHPGGHSSYRVSWWGPWIGFDAAYATCDCGTYYSELEFHFARVRRERDSHQGVDNDHYQRTKTGYIFAWKVGAAFALCDCWILDASLKYTDGWSTNSCTDSVNWRSGQIRLDAGYRF